MFPVLRDDDEPRRARARLAADRPSAVRGAAARRAARSSDGDPQQVADKILAQHELFGHQRFLAHMGMGGLEHAKVLRAIELLGTEVAPRVREALAAGVA